MRIDRKRATSDEAEAPRRRPLIRSIVVVLVAAFCLQASPLWSDTEDDQPAPPRSQNSSSDRGSTTPGREPAKKYEWLFKRPKEQEVAREANQAVIFSKLDRDIKEARRVYLSGKLDAAMAAYRKAIDDFESVLDDIPQGHSLLSQLEERFSVFDEFITKILGPIQSAPSGDSADQIFQLLERRRVCMRNLVLKKAGTVEFFDVPKNLLNDEGQLQRKLLEVRSEVPSPSARQASEATQNSLSDLRKSLDKSSPRYALFRKGSRLGLPKVSRDLLRKTEMILDFSLLSDRMVVGVITSESAAYYQIPVNRSDVDREVLNLQERLREFAQGDRSTFMGHAWKEPARRIYRFLLGRLPALPENKKTVFAIPDRSLWYLPFSVMLDADDRPFGRDRLITIIPSVDMLHFLRTQKSDQSGTATDLLLLESIPWIATEEVRQTTAASPGRRKIPEKKSDEEEVERLILNNPVYPRPSEIVINIQKMFKKSHVWIGPTATPDRLANTKDSSQEIAVLAAPLSVNDKLDAENPPTFFFSPDKNGRRTFDARMLFSTPLVCQLTVLPVAWFEVKDIESIRGEGPLLLSSALFYSGSRMYMVNYSDPDWGTDEEFLISALKKMSEKTPPGKALAEYTRDISSSLGVSFAGKPPSWVGWILMGDPN